MPRHMDLDSAMSKSGACLSRSRINDKLGPDSVHELKSMIGSFLICEGVKSCSADELMFLNIFSVKVKSI